MTEHAERGAPVWSADNVVAVLLVRDANPVALIALAGAAVLAACRAVLSPPIVFSSEMTWDLLFNLGGAWHLRFGHVPHVDFHEPVGALNFMLTALGFALVGDTPHALLVGVAIVAAFIFGAACVAAWRRLALLPAAIFVVFACLLVLRPANVGDAPNAYSFAMTYNRYGWSGVSVIALILFLPPRRARWADIVEMSLVAAMLVAMFHLKVTYFLVGGGLIVASFVTSPHVRVRWPGWLAVGAIGLAAALLPSSQPYLADLAAAARAGVVRDDAAFFFNDIAENAGQYAPYVAALAIAVWLWRHGSATVGLPVASVVLLLGALSLLSQNSQSHGVPLALVIAFLLYETLRSGRAQAGRAVMLGALLAFPLASIVGSATSIFGYQARTGAGYMHVVDSTNLRGLAVPRQPGDVIAEFSRDRPTYRLLSRARGAAALRTLAAGVRADPAAGGDIAARAGPSPWTDRRARPGQPAALHARARAAARRQSVVGRRRADARRRGLSRRCRPRADPEIHHQRRMDRTGTGALRRLYRAAFPEPRRGAQLDRAQPRGNDAEPSGRRTLIGPPHRYTPAPLRESADGLIAFERLSHCLREVASTEWLA